MKNFLKLLIGFTPLIFPWTVGFVAANGYNSFYKIPNYPLERNQKTQAIPIAGTKVRLVPPVGFNVSSQFSGYVQELTGASILVTEIPGSFADVSASFSDPKKLAQLKLNLLNQQEVIFNQQNGLLFQFQQKDNDENFLKWILVFGNDQESVLIIATLPQDLENSLSESLKASLLSAEWDQERIVSRKEGLNFTVKEIGNLKLAQRVGNTVLYSQEGIFPSQNLDDPIFIVGQSLGQIIINDQENFAKSRLEKTTSITEVKIENLQKVVIDELEGYEIIASGKDFNSQQPILIYQTILFLDNRNYYIMQGIVSIKSKESSVDLFKSMANSFRRTNNSQE